MILPSLRLISYGLENKGQGPRKYSLGRSRNPVGRRGRDSGKKKVQNGYMPSRSLGDFCLQPGKEGDGGILDERTAETARYPWTRPCVSWRDRQALVV